MEGKRKEGVLNTPIQNLPIDIEKHPIVEFNWEQTQKTIYLPSPFDENRFSKEDSKETPTPTSLYVINYDTINNKVLSVRASRGRLLLLACHPK